MGPKWVLTAEGWNLVESLWDQYMLGGKLSGDEYDTLRVLSLISNTGKIPLGPKGINISYSLLNKGYLRQE